MMVTTTTMMMIIIIIIEKHYEGDVEFIIGQCIHT